MSACVLGSALNDTLNADFVRTKHGAYMTDYAGAIRDVELNVERANPVARRRCVRPFRLDGSLEVRSEIRQLQGACQVHNVPDHRGSRRHLSSAGAYHD